MVIDKLREFFKDSRYEFVLLFGSYSSNTQNELSDIDIGIFFKDKIDYMDLGYQSAKLESILQKKIDMIVLNDLYRKDPLFAFEILNNHKPILLNNEKSYIDFKTFSQLFYLDHKPLIELNQKTLLNRIKNGKTGERNFVTEN
jgi:predicted nucleotidyltransferase